MRILILAALSVGPAAQARAQDAIIDPGPDTPAGTQYQIPVDSARQDAAPTRRATPRHNGTTLQSENGFGSSSVVPGVATRPAPVAVPAGTAAKPTSRVHHRRGSAPGTKRSRTLHTVAAGPVPVTPRTPPPAQAPSAAPPASTSSGSSGLILLLGSVAVAGGVGSATRRRR